MSDATVVEGDELVGVPWSRPGDQVEFVGGDASIGLGELRAATRAALLDEAAALLVLREAGMSWPDLGRLLGLSRSGAQAHVARVTGGASSAVSLVGERRRAELAELLTVEAGGASWEVRVRGVRVSAHRSIEAAERAAARVEAGAGEVWEVLPGGRGRVRVGADVDAVDQADEDG